jgi:hypothetical protein
MTREELLELAALDAFGLLDEYEAALYSRSFHHAPVAVQDEIRDVQAALASEEALLPNVEPDPGLRQRVLQAVNEAIEADSLRLAPLAMIGRARRDDEPARGPFRLISAGQVWRAATFVLAGSLLVVLYFGIQFYDRNEQITDYALGQRTYDQVRELLGPDLLDYIHNPNCSTVRLLPVDQRSAMNAVVFVNESTGEGFLYAFAVDPDAPYTLVATGPGGETIRQEFTATNAIHGVRLTGIDTTLLGSLSWSIADASGMVVLRTA